MQGEILSQCKRCFSIEILTDEKKKTTKYQHSICELPKVPAKECYSCKQKPTMTIQLSDCCKAKINSNNDWEHRHECSECGRHIGTPLDETENQKSTTSDQQRKSMHLLFTFVAKEYDAAGYGLMKLLEEFPTIDVPVNSKHVKEIWRAAQLEHTGKESTNDLTTQEINEVFDIFNRHVALAGIHVPFPSLETLYNKTRKELGL